MWPRAAPRCRPPAQCTFRNFDTETLLRLPLLALACGLTLAAILGAAQWLGPDSRAASREQASVKPRREAIEVPDFRLPGDGDRPFSGNPNGDVTVVEFLDYQCGYCKRSYDVLKAVVATDSGIKVVYIDFPILGEVSRIAAFAVLAANRQGKYFALHSALMEFRGRLDRVQVLELAQLAALDLPRLVLDMEGPEVRHQLEGNIELASKLGVRGTPTFIVGKHLVVGAMHADTLRDLIAEARDASRVRRQD